MQTPFISSMPVSQASYIFLEFLFVFFNCLALLGLAKLERSLDAFFITLNEYFLFQ